MRRRKQTSIIARKRRRRGEKRKRRRRKRQKKKKRVVASAGQLKQKGRGWLGGVARGAADVYNTFKMASAVARNAPKNSIFRRTAMMRYGNPYLERKLYKRH